MPEKSGAKLWNLNFFLLMLGLSVISGATNAVLNALFSSILQIAVP